MKKTVCELFAGVGGFRCGLNHIKTLEDVNKKEKWDTVWFNQWEPAEKKTQYAHDCYVYRFGNRYDINGNDTTKDVYKRQWHDPAVVTGNTLYMPFQRMRFDIFQRLLPFCHGSSDGIVQA